MDLTQFKGPFYSNQVITIPAEPGYTYVHIGIQVPKRQPIAVPVTTVSRDGKTTTPTGEWRNMAGKMDPIIQINDGNNQQFVLNECDVLEFDGLSEIAWTIRFLKTLPAESIIDIVRRT